MADDAASADRTLPAHLHAIVQKRLSRLLASGTYWRAEDPVEAVHDVRVASRRLRALLDVFRNIVGERGFSRAKKPLRRLTRAMGPLRDADVQLELVTERLRATEAPLERAALEHLVASIARARLAAEEDARRTLERMDFGELSDAVIAAGRRILPRLPEPGVDTSLFVLSLLSPITGAVEEAECSLGEPDDERLHRFRIALKKLRYGMELFEPVLGTSYENLHADVARLQDLLGAHHDLTVLGALAASESALLREHECGVLAGELAALSARISGETRAALEGFITARTATGTLRARLEAALLSVA